MPDFKGIENFYLIFLFVVPGLVIVYVRSRFISGHVPSHTENALGYFVLSILYYAFTPPIIERALNIREPLIERAAVWIGLTLVGPAIFGVLLGAWAQKEWGGWIAHKLGLDTIHVIPAAWDWRFSKIPRGGMFMMVTLTNGRVWPVFSVVCFVRHCRTGLYIEEEYTVDGGQWEARADRVGILIPAKEIRYIEFWEGPFNSEVQQVDSWR